MSHERKGNSKGNRLIIDYGTLGTIAERELIDAFIDDMHMIEDEFGIRYYTGAKLILWGTNEYGDPLIFRRHGGPRVDWLHTSHYRPACLDYDL